jgi:hypothetical protein
MKPISHPSLQETSMLEFDLKATFEKLWREVDEREKRDANSGLVQHMVRLDCTDELVDIGSVGLLGLREAARGSVLIDFVCPRCDELHRSRRFRRVASRIDGSS